MAEGEKNCEKCKKLIDTSVKYGLSDTGKHYHVECVPSKETSKPAETPVAPPAAPAPAPAPAEKKNPPVAAQAPALTPEPVPAPPEAENPKKWYAGVRGDRSGYDVFSASKKPTRATHGHKYQFIEGPFDTQHDAVVWARKMPGDREPTVVNNPPEAETPPVDDKYELTDDDFIACGENPPTKENPHSKKQILDNINTFLELSEFDFDKGNYEQASLRWGQANGLFYGALTGNERNEQQALYTRLRRQKTVLDELQHGRGTCGNPPEEPPAPVENPKYTLPPTYRLSKSPGAGCFLEPPGHPRYFVRSIYTQHGNSPHRGPQYYLNGYGYDSLEAVDRLYGRESYPKLPLDHPRTKAWIRTLYSYFAHCYSPDGITRDVSKCVIDNNAELPPERHLAVMMIREKYPEYQPDIDQIKAPSREGTWWEHLETQPTPETCPGDAGLREAHPVNGSWCQVCGWHDEPKAVTQASNPPTEENPSFGDPDHRVVKAFTEHKAADGTKLTTDGKRLDGNWMGGRGIAEWKDDKIVFHDLGSRSAQSVHRLIRKEAAPADLAGYAKNPPTESENPKILHTDRIDSAVSTGWMQAHTGHQIELPKPGLHHCMTCDAYLDVVTGGRLTDTVQCKPRADGEEDNPVEIVLDAVPNPPTKENPHTKREIFNSILMAVQDAALNGAAKQYVVEQGFIENANGMLEALTEAEQREFAQKYPNARNYLYGGNTKAQYRPLALAEMRTASNPPTAENPAGHTPGPWTAVGRGRLNLPSGTPVETAVIEARGWGRIGEWYDYSNMPDENERLIAAAPELFVALERLLDMVTDNRTHGPEVDLAADVLHKARGTIDNPPTEENPRNGVIKLDHHRNGSGGRSFHVALIRDGKQKLLAIRPDDPHDKQGTECFVIDPALAAQGEIRYTYNSWDGVYFVKLVDDAIAKNEAEYLAKRNPPTAENPFPEHPEGWTYENASVEGVLEHVDTMALTLKLKTDDGREHRIRMLDPNYHRPGSEYRSYTALKGMQRLVGRRVAADLYFHPAFGWTLYGRRKLKVVNPPVAKPEAKPEVKAPEASKEAK